MKRFLIMFVFAWVALPLLVIHAQDSSSGDGVPDLNGNYTMSGASSDGSNPYTGTGTFTGFGSVYQSSVQYSYQNAAETNTFLVMGNVVVDGSGDPQCSDTAYSRLDDGTLIGMWINSTGGGTGIEVLTPTASTTDFAGSYTLRGIYPSGAPYGGTVEISVGSDNLYTLNYDFPADSLNPALVTTGYGLASNNILGVTLPLDPTVDPSVCTLFVATVDANGTQNGTWYQNGTWGTETITPR